MIITLRQFKKRLIKAWPEDRIRKDTTEDFLTFTFQQYADVMEIRPNEYLLKQLEDLGCTINRKEFEE